MYNLVASNLTMIFDPQKGPVFENISLKVAPGELVCILGPSGCGKTTLLRILAGLQKPTFGIVERNETQVHKGVSYIPQWPVLMPWRTVIENVALGLECQPPPGRGVKEARIGITERDNIRSIIRKYRLEGLENRFPDRLSGGETQRVAVVRELLTNPGLLFADEPFSAVDFVTRLELNMLFRQKARGQGTTTVFVTHNIEEAVFLADTVVVLSGQPARVVDMVDCRLDSAVDDPVLCRADSLYQSLFARIWKSLSIGG